LVERHLDFVHFAALRRCGSGRAAAEDVTQQVFTLLAHNASSMVRRVGCRLHVLKGRDSCERLVKDSVSSLAISGHIKVNTMTDDAQLLREYVAHRSEVAFAELVRRHLGLVYHSAARQLGDEAHLASDVAQGVFILLGARSRSLLTHPSLASWLHATTHFKVAELRRAEKRRRAREQVAHFMHELEESDFTATDFERLRPMIDEVLLELNETDREAVLLRFFENRPFAEIAARLRLTENTAHKRVERALESLRGRLGRRGVKSTAAALGAALAGQSALAVPPAGLAASVTGAVVASGLPGAAAWSFVSFMSTKTTATAAAIVMVVAGGVATHQVSAERDAIAALATLEKQNAALVAQIRAVESYRTIQPNTATPAVAPRISGASTPNSELARRLGSGGFASVEESRAFLQANPDVRDALVSFHHAQLSEQYAELFPTLGLTDLERQRFLTLLNAGMRRIVGEHQFSVADETVSGVEIGRQLRELLGEARYQQYRAFRDNSPARDVTRELTRSLYFTPAPLTPVQAIEFKRVVEQTIADPALGEKYTGAWPYVPAPIWEKVVTEAHATLTEPQIEALRELQQRSQFFHLQSAAARDWRAKQKETAK